MFMERKYEIVIVKESEEKYIEVAKKLGIKNLVMLYEVNKLSDLSIFLDYKRNYDINIYLGALIRTNNKKRIKRLTVELYYNKNLFNDLTVVEATSPDIVRYISDLRFVNIIINAEWLAQEDHLHYRKSGLNHIVARRLKENNIALGIPFAKLINTEIYFKGKIFGRILQNVQKLYKKYKFKIIVASFAEDPHLMRRPEDLISLGIVLGLDYQKALEMISKNVEEQMKRIREVKDPTTLGIGFKIVKYPFEDYEDY